VLGDSLRDRLDGLAGHSHVRAIRGAGLMIGLALDAPGRALELVQRLLDRGYLALPAGHDADVLQITPPLTIAEPLLERFIETLGALLEENAGRNA
jgi:4-aminobutyrate aminotransferase-like enzyme